MRNFTLTQLIKPEVLQQIQDAFSDYTGMAAITTNAEGVPVTEGSNFLNFCTNVIRGTEPGLRYCKKCDKNGALETMRTGTPAVYCCHAGLVDFSAPIMVNGRLIGCFVGGQVLTGELDEELCRKKAAEYNIDPDVYIAEAKKAVRLSEEQVRKSAKLLCDIAKALSSMALQSFAEIEKSRSLEIAARSQSDYIISVITDILSVTGEYLRTARDALKSQDPQQMKETLEFFTNQGSGSSGMIRDSITYLKTAGKQFRMSEEEYTPHTAIRSVIEDIQKRFSPEGVSIGLEISDSLPEMLLGDAGGMCQLIDKLISFSADHGAKRIDVKVSSSKHSYAEMIRIKIITDILDVTDEQIETVNSIISCSDDFTVANSAPELGLTIARTLIRTMSGEFKLSKSDAGAEFRIELPQLEIKGGAS